LIFPVHPPNQVPKVIAVRGITRHVGTTSLAANLALLLARRNEKVLLLDLSLWNCDLTRAFGYSPASALYTLAQQFYDHESLPLEAIETSVQRCRQNLDLLPVGEHWLEMAALRAENGWNFVMTLLATAKARWNFIVADLGSYQENSIERTDYIFRTANAVHAAMLFASQGIINVCDSIVYLKLWQEQASQDFSVHAKTRYIVNQYRADKPFGLEKYAVDEKMRSSSHFVPRLKSGLYPIEEGLFFVERSVASKSFSREERTSLRELEGITSWICNIP